MALSFPSIDAPLSSGFIVPRDPMKRAGTSNLLRVKILSWCNTTISGAIRKKCSN